MNAIEIRQLHFTYPDGPCVFRGLDLAIAEGEAVGLLGPNGSGKSTLVQVLVGLVEGRGEIRIGGVKLGRSTRRQIRRRLGLVFQDAEAQLFMPTVLDDVAFGPLNQGLERQEALEASRQALGVVEMSGSENRSSHHLSGGEKRRVALATVLAMRPEILLLDEPSLNLDPRARRGLIRLLAGMSITKLITSHDLDMVWDLCERIVILDEGRIVADGPAEEILRDEALLRAHGLDAPLSLQPRGDGRGGKDPRCI